MRGERGGTAALVVVVVAAAAAATAVVVVAVVVTAEAVQNELNWQEQWWVVGAATAAARILIVHRMNCYFLAENFLRFVPLPARLHKKVRSSSEKYSWMTFFIWHMIITQAEGNFTVYYALFLSIL